MLLFASCGGRQEKANREGFDTIPLQYSKLLQFQQRGDGVRMVTIRNPWKPQEQLHRYVIVKKGEQKENLPEGTVVEVPLERMTVFTSVHCRLMQDLGALDRVSGVCDFEYVQSEEIRRRVEEHLIGNMGSALNPNVELILSGKADGLLVSPFEKSGYGTLERTGIPLIECADYMEPSALGRMEWVKFYGMLVDREAEADSMFRQVEQRYNELKTMASEVKEKPTLLCDLMNGAAWYVPGGQSTVGKVYQDAGANYLFADRKESGSIRLSFETVYSRGRDADFWLLKYGRSESFTYKTLAKEKAQYTQFAAYKNKKVYGCNTLRVPFYDKEPFHPDRMLADVIHIIHPELLPDHELIFFKPLEDE